MRSACDNGSSWEGGEGGREKEVEVERKKGKAWKEERKKGRVMKGDRERRVKRKVKRVKRFVSMGRGGGKRRDRGNRCIEDTEQKDRKDREERRKISR